MQPTSAPQKIGLGTVQFGLRYGVANRSGQVPREEVARILEAAWAGGVRILDTAPGYGESERVLGETPGTATRFSIVTKTEVAEEGVGGERAARGVIEGLERSLSRLGAGSVHGLLEHRPDRLLGKDGDEIFGAMRCARERGLAKRIGVSVYGAAQLDRILERYDVDLVQVPISVFDQRLIASDHLRRLREAGIEIHARSVLLQGIAGMHPDSLPGSLAGLRPALARLARLAAQEGLSPVSAAIAFVCDLPEVDVVLCGVEDRRQLQEILTASRHHYPATRDADLAALALQDPDLIDPSRWTENA